MRRAYPTPDELQKKGKGLRVERYAQTRQPPHEAVSAVDGSDSVGGGADADESSLMSSLP